jgi:tRNA(His) 5'-end guanylyltransferase
MSTKDSAIAALQAMHKSTIPTQMKLMETGSGSSIPSTESFIVRLDGCSFHTLLNGVHKPFDHRITTAMKKVTVDLIKKFGDACCAFTISDEISILFPASNQTTLLKRKAITITHPYNGRIQKIISITAGFASARLNYHLSNPEDQWDSNPILKKRMRQHLAFFDSRAFIVDAKVAADCIYWCILLILGEVIMMDLEML